MRNHTGVNHKHAHVRHAEALGFARERDKLLALSPSVRQLNIIATNMGDSMSYPRPNNRKFLTL